MLTPFPQYPPLMNADQVAELLNCKPSTVCKLCRNHELVAIKVGKNWSISQERLQDFIKKKEMQTSNLD